MSKYVKICILAIGLLCLVCLLYMSSNYKHKIDAQDNEIKVLEQEIEKLKESVKAEETKYKDKIEELQEWIKETEKLK